MKKILSSILLACLFFTLSSFATDSCDDPYVVNSYGDADHPFWGKAAVGSYSYIDENNCLTTVTCYNKYIFWIKVGTTSSSESLC